MKARLHAKTRLSTYYYNGVDDRPRFDNALQEAAASLNAAGNFLGDSMLIWGRSMSFALNSNFMSAFNAAAPDHIERSIIWRTHILHGAAVHGLRLGGDFVEAACYRGFTAKVIADALDFAKVQKTYWLYDRFEVPSDPMMRLSHHTDDLFDRVKERFSDFPNVRVIKGDVPEVFAEAMPDRISFLHLDMNNAAAEIGALDALWDRVVPGAFIVLDDYGWNVYRDQKEAEDEWFANRDRMIIELPTGQGLVIK